MVRDPDQVKNRAADPALARVKALLSAQMDRYMKETGDPRAKGPTDFWDKVPYTGPKFKGRPID